MQDCCWAQAIKTGDTVYVSGQLGLVPGEKTLSGGIEEQTHQTLKNLGAVLQQAGGSLETVAKTTVLLSDMGDFQVPSCMHLSNWPLVLDSAEACPSAGHERSLQ